MRWWTPTSALDPNGRIRAEAAAAGQVVFVVTDARVEGAVDVTGVVRSTLAETEYDLADLDPERCVVLTQSSVMTPPWQQLDGTHEDDPEAVVASEQTTVFGYACSDTPERMPLPIQLAHQDRRRAGSPGAPKRGAGARSGWQRAGDRRVPGRPPGSDRRAGAAGAPPGPSRPTSRRRSSGA